MAGRALLPFLTAFALAARGASAAEGDRYAVTVDWPARQLVVEARFGSLPPGPLRVDAPAAPFLSAVESRSGGAWTPAEAGGASWYPSCARRAPCEVRYRFDLSAAAAALKSRDTVFAHRDVVLASPSAWLLRPRDGDDDRPVRLHVHTPKEVHFVTGLFPAQDRGHGLFVARGADLEAAPYTGFGPFAVERLAVGGAELEVALSAGALTASPSDLLSWVERSADATSSVYGRFPVPRAAVILLSGSRRPVGYGTALGNGGASVVVWVGEQATERDFSADWVLTHEMVHLGFPNLPRRHLWIEEGLATYLEPLAGARRAGDERVVWRELVEGLQNGAPATVDGLDTARTWGRVYWGGALFFLLADVEIRERTGNRRTLRDVLRAIQAEGGSIAVSWSLERMLEVADRAAGAPVLAPLYERLGRKGEAVDLAALWRRLGVVVEDGRVVALDDAAPLASVRRSIAGRSDAVADAAAATPRP